MPRLSARHSAILATVAILVGAYSITVAVVVRISVALRIRIATIVVAIRIRTTVAAVVAIISGRTVVISRTAAAVTSCESRNQDSTKGHCHFSIANRFHISSFTIHEAFLTYAPVFVDAFALWFLAASSAAAFTRSVPPSP